MLQRWTDRQPVILAAKTVRKVLDCIIFMQGCGAMHANTRCPSRFERNQTNLVIFSVGNCWFGESVLLALGCKENSNSLDASRQRVLGARHRRRGDAFREHQQAQESFLEATKRTPILWNIEREATSAVLLRSPLQRTISACAERVGSSYEGYRNAESSFGDALLPAHLNTQKAGGC